MSVEVQFRALPDSRGVAQIARRVALELAAIEQLGSGQMSWLDSLLDRGQGESASLDLTPFLDTRFRGGISFAPRVANALAGTAAADDVLVVRFDKSDVEFSCFVRRAFPEVVTAFRPYRACVITDRDVAIDDFELVCERATSTGVDVDGRDGVFRLWPAMFLSDSLCRRSFSLDAAELVRRLHSKVPVAESKIDGAFLVLSEQPLVGTALDDLDSRIRDIADLGAR